MPIEQMIFPFCFLVGAISVLNAFSNNLIPFYLLFIFTQSNQYHFYLVFQDFNKKLIPFLAIIV